MRKRDFVDAQIELEDRQHAANAKRAATQLVFSLIVGVVLYIFAISQGNGTDGSMWAGGFAVFVLFLLCSFYNLLNPARLSNSDH